MDPFIHSLPPVVLAVLAIAVVALWQMSGTALVFRLLRLNGLPTHLAGAIGYLAWLPLSGAVVLAVIFAGVASRAVFLGLAVVTMAGGSAVIFRVAGRRKHLRAWPVLSRSTWLLILLALVVQGAYLIFAAHPQRLHDQLNYHLVVAKRALSLGDPYHGTYDSHVLIAGAFELALVWIRSLWNNDFFAHAAGQVWVYVHTMVGSLGVLALFLREGGWTAARTVRATALFAVAFPALIPNNELLHIFKPGGIVLSLTLFMLYLLVAEKRLYLSVAVGGALLACTVKLTFVHAGLALAAGWAVRLLVTPQNEWRWRPIAPALVGAGCLALTVAKNLVYAGSPLYPADARWFPSELSDERTIQFWHDVAFGSGQSFWERYAGSYLVPWRSETLSVWLVAVLLLGGLSVLRAVRRRRNHPAVPLGVYLGVFVALWPFFYGGMIHTRFVVSYVGGLVVLGLYLWSGLEVRRLWLVAGLLVALGLSFSSLDVIVRKTLHWNQKTADAAVADQVPRLEAFRFLNPHLSPGDLVVLDDPIRYYLDPQGFFGGRTPRQRKLWERFEENPRRSAERYRLKGIVRARNGEWQNRPGWDYGQWLARMWKHLEPYGRVKTFGNIQVLFSPCAFQSAKCR